MEVTAPGMAEERHAPETITIQPTPWLAIVAHLDEGSLRITAIARSWREGDPARCQLCSTCKASYDHCLVVASEHVPIESAALFSIRNMTGPERQNGIALAGTR